MIVENILEIASLPKIDKRKQDNKLCIRYFER